MATWRQASSRNRLRAVPIPQLVLRLVYAMSTNSVLITPMNWFAIIFHSRCTSLPADMITRHLRIHEKGGAHAAAGPPGVGGAPSPLPSASGRLTPSPTRFGEMSALPTQAPAAFQFFQSAGGAQAAALPAGSVGGACASGARERDELDCSAPALAFSSASLTQPPLPRFLPLVSAFGSGPGPETGTGMEPEQSVADDAMEATLHVPSSRDSLLCSPHSPRSLHSAASAHSPLSSPRFSAPAPKFSVDSACDLAPPLPQEAPLAEAGACAGAIAAASSASLAACERPSGAPEAEHERLSPEAAELPVYSAAGAASVPTFTRKSPTPL